MLQHFFTIELKIPEYWRETSHNKDFFYYRSPQKTDEEIKNILLSCKKRNIENLGNNESTSKTYLQSLLKILNTDIIDGLCFHMRRLEIK